MSWKPVSKTDFALPRRRNSFRWLFYLKTPLHWTRLFLLTVSPLLTCFIQVLLTICPEESIRRTVSKLLVLSHLATEFCPLSKWLISTDFSLISRCKRKNNSWDPVGVFKYHFTQIMCLPHHPGKFITKCESDHNVFAVIVHSRFYIKLDYHNVHRNNLVTPTRN